MLQGALEHFCSNLDKSSSEAADKYYCEFYPSIAHLRDMPHGRQRKASSERNGGKPD